MRPWVMKQNWYDLAFLHWRVDPDVMRALVPPTLEVDTFDGSAWIAVVPFRMTAAPRGAPFPLDRFAELNVRTYVRHGEKSGVYFFSLDCASPLAVFGARTFFHLPYFDAKMRIEKHDDWFEYESKRTDARGTVAGFSARYRPVGEVFSAQPESLEYFLTERYCLLLEHDNKPFCCDIHHVPWPLQKGEIEISSNTMLSGFGLDVDGKPPHVLFAQHLDVITWMLERRA